ncbi:MAG TPA: tRNA (adenosine(37)-N6)-threonylcarbamoyltransferase complex dimerization subunit type 1 TsaB [Clostridia bacterium]|nr:tRNA (adenosine(37)-N6)-threonylcarbamoyltransferase complex dimerization subunit type 1 TsaB [Clostridia bacterium]
MRVLGLESATTVAGIALVEEEKVIAEVILNTRKTHSQRLMPMLAQLLEEAEVELADLDGLVVSGGPGSFTGLRIGMATIKGLAFACQKPVAVVSTLDSLALNLQGTPGLICPILNARRNEVYVSLYSFTDQGFLERCENYQAITPAQVVNMLSSRPGPVTFLGDGVGVYGQYLLEALGDRGQVASPLHNLPRATNLAWLGLERLKKGLAEDISSLRPFYIRPSEAEVKWRQRNL